MLLLLGGMYKAFLDVCVYSAGNTPTNIQVTRGPSLKRVERVPALYLQHKPKLRHGYGGCIGSTP